MRAGTFEVLCSSTRRRPPRGDLLPIEACRARTVAYTEAVPSRSPRYKRTVRTGLNTPSDVALSLLLKGGVVTLPNPG